MSEPSASNFSLANRHVELCADVSTLAAHARSFAAQVVGMGIEASRFADIRLAVHEALTNALMHGHLGDHTVPIQVALSGAPDAVEVAITDQGRSGAWATPAATDPTNTPLAEDGRGLMLMRSCADQLGIDRGTHTVIMRFWKH